MSGLRFEDILIDVGTDEFDRVTGYVEFPYFHKLSRRNSLYKKFIYREIATSTAYGQFTAIHPPYWNIRKIIFQIFRYLRIFFWFVYNCDEGVTAEYVAQSVRWLSEVDEALVREICQYALYYLQDELESTSIGELLPEDIQHIQELWKNLDLSLAPIIPQ